jgi:hypothetical protein
LRLLGAVAVLAVLSAPAWADAEPASAPVPSPIQPAEIVDRYVKALEVEQSHPQPVSMEVDMDAKLPSLKKQGRLHALRFITRVGQIFYPPRNMRYEGDNTIKKEVIARYLQAEKEARTDYAGELAVTPANYKFKYKGTTDYAGTPAWVFQVSPKRKRLGLYKGELWIDQQTYLPLREWGELVKNPSVFLKNVYFVRDYYLYGGVSVPRRLISDIQTRLVGHAQLTIWYENIKVGEPAPATAAVLSATPEATHAGGGDPRATNTHE